MPDLLAGLNKEQLAAVTHESGPLLILAGAGTGKTTVITRRIAWLLAQKKATPSEILALTFTNKAAQEMEERVDLLTPLGFSDFWISTFHAFCERVLKLHGLDAGLPNDFELLSETGSWLLVRKNLEKFPLDYYKPLGNPAKFITALIKHFSRLKDELVSPAEYLAYAESLELAGGSAELLPEDNVSESKRIRELAECYHFYQKLLLEQGKMDLADLNTFTVQLFRKRPNVLLHYQKKFKYIFVDEFQDTNHAQYELVKLLTQQHIALSAKVAVDSEKLIPNLCVVGDDDQSIYKFRGASVSNILQFAKDFPSSTQITLKDNYRSSQNILDLAYTFIQHNNPDRLEVKLGVEKKLVNPKKPKGGEVLVLEAKDLNSEHDLVINKIRELKDAHPHLTYNDFAVLARSNATIEAFLPRFEQAGIPYSFVANTGLFRKPLIADLVAYMGLLDNHHETAALFRVFSLPKFHLPQVDISTLFQYAKTHTLSLYETLQTQHLLNTLDRQSREKIAVLLKLLHKHSELARERTAAEVFVQIVVDLGLPEYLEEETLENAQNREFLDQFYKYVETFEQESGKHETSVKELLNRLRLEEEAGNEGSIDFDPNSGPESVKLMTVHSSKGLEFERVFVVGLVDQRFPARDKKEAIELPDELVKEVLPEGNTHLQEERRLFYVAMTRAKSGLYFAWARDYGGERAKKPSVFLEEAGLLMREKKSEATGKVVFSKTARGRKKIVFTDLPERFSYSAINAFRTCALDYKYRYYMRLPLPSSGAASFGSTIHAALEKFMHEYLKRGELQQIDLFGKTSKVELPSLEDLMHFYEESWVDEFYQTREDKEKHKTLLGPEILKKFYEYTKANEPNPKLVEQEFELPLGPYKFVGKIDRADSSPEGLVIFDYKTGKAPSTKSAEDLDQLLIYQWAAESLELKVAKMQYWYLKEAPEKQFLEVSVVDQEKLLDLQQKLLELVETIRDAVKYDKFSAIHASQKQHFCQYAGWKE